MSTYDQSQRHSQVSDMKDEEKEIGDSRRTSQFQSPEATRPSTATISPENSEPPKDWDSPQDPDNPQNWPKRKKIYHTFVPASIAFVCTIASSIYTPGTNSVQQELGVSAEVALLPYVLYVLGLAFGPIISAPCSEEFGRRAVYLIAMGPFALFTLGAGFSQSIAALCVCRFFAGIFGSPGLSIGSATLSDIWTPAQRAPYMAVYVTTPFLGPAIGPLVGGYSTMAYSWRWTQWSLLFFTVACLTPALFMKETYKSVIIRRRNRRRGYNITKPAVEQPLSFARKFITGTLTRPIHMFCVEPVVAAFTTYIALNFGMLYSFFAAFPYVFETQYGYNLGQIGLTFLGLGVGVIIGCGLIILYGKTIFKRQHARASANGTSVPPESRLYIAMLGSILLPISLFWFGWTAEHRVHWIVPVIAEAFFGCGNLLIFMAAVLYLMDFYGPLYGASAMAANNLARYLLGAAFPLFIVQMYKGLGIGWATSLLGFVSVACMPIPWAFYIWGSRLRERSRYQKS